MHKMYYLTRQPKEKKTTPASRVPAWFLCHDMVLCHCEIAAKSEVSEVRHNIPLKKYVSKVSQGTTGAAGLWKRLKNRMADCCTLLKRITELKCENSEFRSVSIDPATEVASIGPMAPCRSHHRNHTRQEWIII